MPLTVNLNKGFDIKLEGNATNEIAENIKQKFFCHKANRFHWNN